MRILILGMNYPPESTGIAPYTAGLAEHLRERGHDVHVVAPPPHYPRWKVWEEYRGGWFRSELINGVPVHRTYAYVPERPRKVLNRLLYDTVFSVSALLRTVFLMKRSDLVFVVSPPIQLGLAAWLLGLLYRAPVFLHIKDIASQAAIGAGMVGRASFVGRMARRLELFTYARVDAIGFICGAFEQHLRAAGVPEEKIVFFPDYIDTGALQPGPRTGRFRDRHGIGERQFVVMYSGGISQKQGLETLVGAAAAVSNHPQFRFVIIGDGPNKGDLLKAITDGSVDNATLLPLQPKEELAEQLSAADVLVLTQKRDVTDAVFPSKLLAYMACQRPIVAATAEESETGRFINTHRIGVVVPPEDPQELAKALVLLAESPDRAAEFAGNARQTVMSMYEKAAVLHRVSATLEQWALSAE